MNWNLFTLRATAVLFALTAGCTADESSIMPDDTSGASDAAGSGGKPNDSNDDADNSQGPANRQTSSTSSAPNVMNEPQMSPEAGSGASTNTSAGGAGGSNDDMHPGAGDPPSQSTPNTGAGGAPAAMPSAAGVTGSQGAAGSAGTGEAGAGGASEPDTLEAAEPPCRKSSKQVVVVGDTYVKFPGTHSFIADLASATGTMYRDASTAGIGTWLGSSSVDFGNGITEQYDRAAVRDPNIIAVIMTGGGDDIFITNVGDMPEAFDCRNNASAPTVRACQVLVQGITDAARALWTSMAGAGVKDVIYMFYPRVPAGSAADTSGTHPNLMLDYLSSMMKPLCDSMESTTGGKLRCHFLDLIPVFDGHNDYFAAPPTQTIPNQKGGRAMAMAVADLLKAKCIGQDDASGCCTP